MVNKKRVTFADILGFSLVSVVEIYPENWFPDRISEKHRSQAKSDRNYRRSQLKCLFDQPVNTEDFHRRVKREHVCLENVVCDKNVIRGFVRVLNVAYAKEVFVRYTMDGWKTFREQSAYYLSTSKDVTTDTFFFGVSLPSDWQVASTVEFAVCYRVSGQEYWDNNYKRNYSIRLGFKWGRGDLTWNQ